MLGPLPFNALIAFEAAARHLSFSKAAAELNVTPAAISQQIRSLEDHLGIVLFERLARRLALTPAAKAALPHLRDGFAKVNEGVASMRSAARPDALNLWMAPSFASKWFMPRLQRFTSRHPDITLNVTATIDLMDTEGGTPALPASALREQGIDVAIRFGKGSYPGCRVEKLMAADAVPLCSPSLMADPANPLNKPEDLCRHTLLHDDTPYEGRPDWPSWLLAAGVSGVDSQRGTRFNRASLALEAARQGLGVVLSIEQLASSDIAAGHLVMPFSIHAPLEYAYYVISLEDSPHAANVDAFRNWLVEEAAL